MLPCDEEQAVLNAVRDLFEPGGFVRTTSGKLHENRVLLASLDAMLPRFVFKKVEISKLSIADLGEATAEVELHAIQTYEGRRSDGRQLAGEDIYAGPVKLVRDGEGWKVEDLWRNGASWSNSIETSDLSGSLKGVNVDALIAISLHSGAYSVLVLEAHNELHDAIPINRAAFGWRKPKGGWTWAPATIAPDELPVGSTRFPAQGPAPTSHSGNELRLLLETPTGVIDIRPPATNPVSRMPLSSRKTIRLVWRYVHWSRDVFATTLAVALLLAVFANVGAAVIVLIVVPLLWVWKLWRQGVWKRRQGRAYFLTASAIAVVGLELGGGLRDLRRFFRNDWPSSAFILVVASLVASYAVNFRNGITVGPRWKSPRWLDIALGLAPLALILYYTNRS